MPKVAKQQPLANYLFLIICNFLQSYKFFWNYKKSFQGILSITSSSPLPNYHWYDCYSDCCTYATHFGKLCITHALPSPFGQEDVHSHCRGDWQIALTKQNFSIITFRIFTFANKEQNIGILMTSPISVATSITILAELLL